MFLTGKLKPQIAIRIIYIGPLQTITPSQMSCANSLSCDSTFRGFGNSFSSWPHVDVDNNGLEDLAIG